MAVYYIQLAIFSKSVGLHLSYCSAAASVESKWVILDVEGTADLSVLLDICFSSSLLSITVMSGASHWYSLGTEEDDKFALIAVKVSTDLTKGPISRSHVQYSISFSFCQS